VKPNSSVKIQVIDEKSPYLETVIALGDANKATLSFFRRGAFIESAAKRQIIIALDSHKNCIGYLLYNTRYRDNYIRLVHLCLDPSVRGQGIAKKLVEYLKKNTQDYNGITLTCRDDYNLRDMWVNFGFVPAYSKLAKTTGKNNTIWRLDYGKNNLLFNLSNQHRENKLSVAIDYSIFVTLTKNDPDEDAASLLATWLEPEVELCVTEEIRNQIYQIDNLEERNRQQQLVDNFTGLPCPHDKFENAFQSIKIFCKTKKININESDMRSIARAITAKIYILVTINQQLLDHAKILYEASKVSILSPDNLIIRLDSVNQKPDYQPVRLSGTQLEETMIPKGEEYNLIDAFSLSGQEDKAEFFQRLRRFIAEKDKFTHVLVKNAENQPLALIVYDTHKPHELEIPLIRVGDHSLSATLARHLIFRAISKAAFDNRQFTRITDPHLDDSIKNAIEEENMFITVQDGYLKINLAQAEPASSLSQQLISLVSNYSDSNNELKSFHQQAENLKSLQKSDFKNLLAIEKLLWPAKITDAQIPTFIIPIQPIWAQELFDYYLSQQCLFSNNTDLALNREAVYYKSKKSPKKLKPGMVGRILWYVSGSDKDKGFIEIQAVRACSILDEVVIGTPEELDLRFRNLGVYKKEDLLKIANGDENQDIMAVKFSTTELFDRPIFLTNIRKILNNKTTIQNSIEITDRQFEQIYKMGYA
jgi:GNAT superfamily N-acetyltransferase